MNITHMQSITTGLDQLPSKEVYYYGPKMTSCDDLSIYKIEEFTFKVYRYDIRGNGALFIEIFDDNKKQIFEKTTIKLSYHWFPGYYIELFNSHSSRSNEYFHFKTNYKKDLNSVLFKLHLSVEKFAKYKSESQSIQYFYAYLIFLFYQNNESSIKASQLSEKYNILKKMKTLISRPMSDNFINSEFSRDTKFYKILERFATKHINRIKDQEIQFD